MTKIVCKFCFASYVFIKSQTVKNDQSLAGIHFSNRTSQIKLESLSIPNLDLSEKIRKVVIK